MFGEFSGFLVLLQCTMQSMYHLWLIQVHAVFKGSYLEVILL